MCIKFVFSQLSPNDPAKFPTGTLEFVVELRSSDTVVLWRPDYPAETAVAEDFFEESTALAVQPYLWIADMPVKFSGP